MEAAPTADYKSLYEVKSKVCDALQLKVLSMEQQLSQLQKMIFGSRHERFIPTDINTSQLSLDIQSETVSACSVHSINKMEQLLPHHWNQHL